MRRAEELDVDERHQSEDTYGGETSSSVDSDNGFHVNK
jgi:hypothetical protein